MNENSKYAELFFLCIQHIFNFSLTKNSRFYTEADRDETFC